MDSQLEAQISISIKEKYPKWHEAMNLIKKIDTLIDRKLSLISNRWEQLSLLKIINGATGNGNGYLGLSSNEDLLKKYSLSKEKIQIQEDFIKIDFKDLNRKIEDLFDDYIHNDEFLHEVEKIYSLIGDYEGKTWQECQNSIYLYEWFLDDLSIFLSILSRFERGIAYLNTYTFYTATSTDQGLRIQNEDGEFEPLPIIHVERFQTHNDFLSYLGRIQTDTGFWEDNATFISKFVEVSLWMFKHFIPEILKESIPSRIYLRSWVIQQGIANMLADPSTPRGWIHKLDQWDLLPSFAQRLEFVENEAIRNKVAWGKLHKNVLAKFEKFDKVIGLAGALIGLGSNLYQQVYVQGSTRNWAELTVNLGQLCEAIIKYGKVLHEQGSKLAVAEFSANVASKTWFNRVGMILGAIEVAFDLYDAYAAQRLGNYQEAQGYVFLASGGIVTLVAMAVLTAGMTLTGGLLLVVGFAIIGYGFWKLSTIDAVKDLTPYCFYGKKATSLTLETNPMHNRFLWSLDKFEPGRNHYIPRQIWSFLSKVFPVEHIIDSRGRTSNTVKINRLRIDNEGNYKYEFDLEFHVKNFPKQDFEVELIFWKETNGWFVDRVENKGNKYGTKILFSREGNYHEKPKTTEHNEDHIELLSIGTNAEYIKKNDEDYMTFQLWAVMKIDPSEGWFSSYSELEEFNHLELWITPTLSFKNELVNEMAPFAKQLKEIPKESFRIAEQFELEFNIIDP